MPETLSHRLRAEHNLTFATSFDLATTPYLDWVVAAYFYAALHWVDALLYDKERINPANHDHRRGFVKDKYYLRGIKNEYRNLYDRSIEARYECLTFTEVKVRDKVIPLYKAIENHVMQQLPKSN